MIMPIFYGRHGCPQLPWFVLKQTQLEFSGEKIPSLFPFLTLSWLLHFQRKTLPYLCLAGWLAATQTSHTESYGLCTNCACCLQHCYLRYLRVSFLISCWFYFLYERAIYDYSFETTPSLPHTFFDFSPKHSSPSNIHLFMSMIFLPPPEYFCEPISMRMAVFFIRDSPPMSVTLYAVSKY